MSTARDKLVKVEMKLFVTAFFFFFFAFCEFIGISRLFH